MNRSEKIKMLERLVSGNTTTTIKVVAYYRNRDGVIHWEQLDKPVEVLNINPEEWEDAIGIVYHKFGAFYFKSIIDEFKRWEGKHEAGIVELPIFFDLELDEL